MPREDSGSTVPRSCGGPNVPARGPDRSLHDLARAAPVRPRRDRVALRVGGDVDSAVTRLHAEQPAAHPVLGRRDVDGGQPGGPLCLARQDQREREDQWHHAPEHPARRGRHTASHNSLQGVPFPVSTDVPGIGTSAGWTTLPPGNSPGKQLARRGAQLANLLRAPGVIPTDTAPSHPRKGDCTCSAGSWSARSARASRHSASPRPPRPRRRRPSPVYNTDSWGKGSLRSAISAAEVTDTRDEIVFEIPGEGVHTIELDVALPVISKPLTIDGYSQLGANPATEDSPAEPKVVIDAANVARGLDIGGDEIEIRGLVVKNAQEDGIVVDGQREHHRRQPHRHQRRRRRRAAERQVRRVGRRWRQRHRRPRSRGPQRDLGQPLPGQRDERQRACDRGQPDRHERRGHRPPRRRYRRRRPARELGQQPARQPDRRPGGGRGRLRRRQRPAGQRHRDRGVRQARGRRTSWASWSTAATTT